MSDCPLSSEKSALAEITETFDHNSEALRRGCDDIYPKLLAQCPVFKSKQWGGFWVATRYDDLLSVARDQSLYRSGAGVMIPSLGISRPMLPMESDPPLHDSYRRLLLPTFGPQAVGTMEKAVRDLAQDRIRAFVSDGQADLYRDLAKPLPTLLITRLLGIKPDERFWDWVETLVYGRLGSDRGAEVTSAANGLRRVFEHELQNRQASSNPSDLIGLLVNAKIDDRPLSHDEILDHCVFLLVAGLENTAFAIRACLWHLGRFQQDQRELREKPEGIRTFVEESLRFYSPVAALARTASRDCLLNGQSIKKGEKVALVFAAANRDSELVPDASRFDAFRKGNRHVAFGLGPHRCLGSNLARLEITVAVEEMLSLVPEFSLVDFNDHWSVAGPLRLQWV